MTNGSMMPKMGANVMINRLIKEVPDYKPPTHFRVGVTTNDCAWADTELNDSVIILGAEYTKQLESITINETDAYMNFEGWLSVTEANGNLITGFAVVNEDTSEKLITKSKFTGVSKTNTELFKINVKVRIKDQADI
jgi:hypothetical protein